MADELINESTVESLTALDTLGSEKPIIPQFREKTMYIKYLDAASGSELENSYTVQSSFKGILRLSPNDTAALKEKTTIQLSSASLDGQENIAFRDSIMNVIELPYSNGSDDEIPSDLKNPTIYDDNDSRQFLRVSESEGYMIDLRIASSSIEANNLFVRGEIQSDQLVLNANAVLKKNKQNAFKHLSINGVGLPVYPDTDNFVTEYNDELVKAKLVAPGVSDISKYIGETDETDIIDKSAILVTDSDNKLVYKNSTELINELILDALMSLASIPTGSIQYFPVTIEQYKKLKGIHNCMYDNMGALSDPLMRDYLLCDGSLYYVKDFPELAKIIRGTSSSYEKYNAGIGKEYYERTTRAEDSLNAENGTFRVPDLRGQFIRSAYLSSNRADEILKGTVGNHRYSQLPCAPNDKTADNPTIGDNHAHYTFYGSYDAKQYSYTLSESEEGDNGKLGSKEYVALLSGYSTTNTFGANIFTFPGVLGASARCYGGQENHMLSHYYITSPQTYDATNFKMNDVKIDMGRTSNDINSIISNETLKAVVDTASSLSIYKGANIDKDLLANGQENAPCFIAVLPFIRI